MEKKENLENSETTDILPIEKSGLLEVSKGFVEQDLESIDSKEEIEQYSDKVASSETKKQLIEAMKKADTIVVPTSGGDSLDKNKNSDRKKMEKELQTKLDKNKGKSQSNNKEELVKNEKDIEQDLTK